MELSLDFQKAGCLGKFFEDVNPLPLKALWVRFKLGRSSYLHRPLLQPHLSMSHTSQNLWSSRESDTHNCFFHACLWSEFNAIYLSTKLLVI